MTGMSAYLVCRHLRCSTHVHQQLRPLMSHTLVLLSRSPVVCPHLHLPRRSLRSSSKTSGVASDARSFNDDKRPSTKAARNPIRHDPVRVAEEVRAFLEKRDITGAENAVRLASKSGQSVIVGWNHIIGWKMSEGKVKDALKTYQEMKKRGQTPDAYTFTTVLRGLSEHAHYPLALSKALSIYHSMSAENSPVKPTTIHTNAALRVCARAGDTEAMYGIAARFRLRGVNAPNSLTFSTILNGIRQEILKAENGTLDSDALTARREKAIVDARRMWDDVITRWRKGDIWIDEDLVCAMGRILLLGNREDIDDLFSLLEQTMNIPRALPKLKTMDRAKIEPGLQGLSKVTDEQPNSEAIDLDIALSFPPGNFDPVQIRGRSEEMNGYPSPGPNTLSLVLEAVDSIHSKASLDFYWEYLTIKMHVSPDSQNFHSHLRNLRAFRASRESLNLLLVMPVELLQKKTFRISLSTCLRDKNNPAAFANAGKMLDLMQTNLADPDIQALSSYLKVAMNSPTSTMDPAKVSSPDPSFESEYRSNSTNFQAQGRQILRALERLEPHIMNLRSSQAYGEFSNRDGSGNMKNLSESTEVPLLDLFKNMISAYDLLMNKGWVDRNIYRNLTMKRAKIAAYISRHMHNKQLARSKKSASQNSILITSERDEIHQARNPAIRHKDSETDIESNISIGQMEAEDQYFDPQRTDYT